jgi:UDP-N-acetylmuramate dehydrogenase
MAENTNEKQKRKRIIRVKEGAEKVRKENSMDYQFWEKEVDLRDKSTMHLWSKAKDFFTIQSDNDLIEFYNTYNNKANGLKGRKVFTLGEGSNTIFINKEIDSVVVFMAMKGYEVEEVTDDTVRVECKAGERFRDFVLEMCEKGYSGLENLAAIYGTVGASPVQNIGAYGAEVKDSIEDVRYFDMRDGEFHTINNKDCRFGYRDSVFKHQDGSKIITEVRFRLNKKFVFNDSYGAVKKAFEGVARDKITPLKVAEKIFEIRNSKLPNPNEIGNCGSFFCNPVIEDEHFQRLRSVYEDIAYFDTEKGKKISGAWLIDSCGFRGRKENGIAMYSKQPLVLVNYGVQNNKYLTDYVEKVQKMVKNKFDIELVAEPHFVY